MSHWRCRQTDHHNVFVVVAASTISTDPIPPTPTTKMTLSITLPLFFRVWNSLFSRPARDPAIGDRINRKLYPSSSFGKHRRRKLRKRTLSVRQAAEPAGRRAVFKFFDGRVVKARDEMCHTKSFWKNENIKKQ